MDVLVRHRVAADPAGRRVATVFVDDASASGLKATMQLAGATQGGCLGILAGALLGIALAAPVAYRLASSLH